MRDFGLQNMPIVSNPSLELFWGKIENFLDSEEAYVIPVDMFVRISANAGICAL